MINLSMSILLGSILPAIISVFIKQNWRLVLLLCPLILPPLFLVIYTITQL
jgi:cytochrome c oxidase subunit IV